MPAILRCPLCGYIWAWGGRGRSRTTCPRCHGTVYFSKPGVVIPLILEGDVPRGAATVRLIIWNGAPSLLTEIRSDDGCYARPMPIDLAPLDPRLPALLDRIAPRYYKYSGEYHLPAPLRDLLAEIFSS